MWVQVWKVSYLRNTTPKPGDVAVFTVFPYWDTFPTWMHFRLWLTPATVASMAWNLYLRSHSESFNPAIVMDLKPTNPERPRWLSRFFCESLSYKSLTSSNLSSTSSLDVLPWLKRHANSLPRPDCQLPALTHLRSSTSTSNLIHPLLFPAPPS